MSDEREGDVVPVSGDPLPSGLLALRRDAGFEIESNFDRIDRVEQWVKPLLLRLRVAVLMGADVMEDDQFSHLVDQVYDGVRERTTRNDLIASFLQNLVPHVEGEAARQVRQAKAQTARLDNATWFHQYMGEAKKSAD